MFLFLMVLRRKDVMTTGNNRIVHISLNFSGRGGMDLFSGVQRPGRLLWSLLRNGFMTYREKISPDPLLVEITWHTNTKLYEFSSWEVENCRKTIFIQIK